AELVVGPREIQKVDRRVVERLGFFEQHPRALGVPGIELLDAVGGEFAGGGLVGGRLSKGFGPNEARAEMKPPREERAAEPAARLPKSRPQGPSRLPGSGRHGRLLPSADLTRQVLGDRPAPLTRHAPWTERSPAELRGRRWQANGAETGALGWGFCVAAGSALGSPGKRRFTVNDEQPPVGLVAGKYRLTRLLGRGGMGSVWEGVHASLGNRVACKFIEPEFVGS